MSSFKSPSLFKFYVEIRLYASMFDRANQVLKYLVEMSLHNCLTNGGTVQSAPHYIQAQYTWSGNGTFRSIEKFLRNLKKGVFIVSGHKNFLSPPRNRAGILWKFAVFEHFWYKPGLSQESAENFVSRKAENLCGHFTVLKIRQFFGTGCTHWLRKLAFVHHHFSFGSIRNHSSFSWTTW